jgi:hypothetical protein
MNSTQIDEVKVKEFGFDIGNKVYLIYNNKIMASRNTTTRGYYFRRAQHALYTYLLHKHPFGHRSHAGALFQEGKYIPSIQQYSSSRQQQKIATAG